MPYVPLTFPPGLYNNGTEYQAKGRWHDANQIRFVQGRIAQRYGSVKRSTSAVTGKARRIIAWTDGSGTLRAAIGTHSKLYAMTAAGVLSDITPVGFTTGTADSTLLVPEVSVWSLDLFGQYLVGVMNGDGVIYEWTLSGAAAAAAGAPTANALVMTSESFLFALGAAGVPRRVQWADQASITTWTPDSTNQAGSFDLPSAGRIMQGKRTAAKTLIFTDAEVFEAVYLANNDVYGFKLLAEGCGVISRHCVAEFSGNCVWMGGQGFFLYNGFVQPLPCDVLGYVFSRMEYTSISQVTVSVDELLGEVTWYYPSNVAGNTTGEPDSYVTWSYAEWQRTGQYVWSYGSVGRMCASDRSGAVDNVHGFKAVQAVSQADGFIYDHEGDTTFGDGTPYIESGPFELGEGDQIMYGRQVISDETTQGDVTATFKTKFYPEGTEYTYGPYTLTNPTPVRFTGRQAKVKFTAVSNNFSLGNMRLEVVPGGKR